MRACDFSRLFQHVIRMPIEAFSTCLIDHRLCFAFLSGDFNKKKIFDAQQNLKFCYTALLTRSGIAVCEYLVSRCTRDWKIRILWSESRDTTRKNMTIRKCNAFLVLTHWPQSWLTVCVAPSIRKFVSEIGNGQFFSASLVWPFTDQ